jgi:hypothetical protein
MSADRAELAEPIDIATLASLDSQFVNAVQDAAEWGITTPVTSGGRVLAHIVPVAAREREQT